MDKKYTVKDFVKKYNDASDQTKEILMKSVMNTKYIPYERKITICEKIIESTYYSSTEKNGVKVKKIHINSPAQYMMYCLNLVNEYTNIKIDFGNVLEEFNLLNKTYLLDVITNIIPERELKEFRMILDMVANDVMTNEYDIHAFIGNQVQRFGELFGTITKPAIEQLGRSIENMDEKTIEKTLSKLDRLIKINDIKEKLKF